MRTTRESTAQIAEETSSTFSRTRVSSSTLPRSPFSAFSRLVPDIPSSGLRCSKAGINGEPLGDDRVGSSTYEAQILTKLYDNKTLPSVHSHVLKQGNRTFPKPRPNLILLPQIKNSRVAARRSFSPALLVGFFSRRIRSCAPTPSFPRDHSRCCGIRKPWTHWMTRPSATCYRAGRAFATAPTPSSAAEATSPPAPI